MGFNLLANDRVIHEKYSQLDAGIIISCRRILFYYVLLYVPYAENTLILYTYCWYFQSLVTLRNWKG